MDPEDLEPRNKTAKPRDLDAMGIGELQDYLESLEAECRRVQEKIAAKKAYLSGAANLFKS